MLAANLGSTVAEFAGISAGYRDLRRVPLPSARRSPRSRSWRSSRSAVVSAASQHVFLAIGGSSSIAYIVSAFLAHPDWSAARSADRPPARSMRPRTGLPSWHCRHHDHAVGPGVHPVLRGRQGPRPEELGRAAPMCSSARSDQRRRGLHRRRVRGDAVRGRQHDITRPPMRPRPSRRWPATCRGAVRGRAPRRVGPRAGVVPLSTGAHDLRGVRLGVRASAGGWRDAPGVLRSAGFFIGFAALFVLIPGLRSSP